jgi:alkanesulfonate monooxygenase SsuD/methylene tetrahydromethanopterin reductase-like flavin-dependent oxidoreductase (luciferase family)
LSLGSDATAAQRADALEELRELAVRAELLGFVTLWLAEPPVTDLAADRVYAEGCTLAASLAPLVGVAHLGVTVGDHDDRHPSIAARDVTSLDHTTRGRAALMLRYRGRSAEAAAICRSLFTQDVTTIEGSTYRVSGAVNHPPPLQHGGPPLVVTVTGPEEIDASLVEQVDGVCVAGTPDEVRAVGVAMGTVTESSAGEGDGPPALLWAGSPLDLVGKSSVAALLGDLRAAGVEGLICRLPVGDGQQTVSAVEELAAAVADWGHR